MKSSEPGGESFLHLWPTVVTQRRLPGHELANKVLAGLIEELEQANPSLTTDYRQSNLLTRDNPAVTWLRDCINKTVIDYLRHVGIDYPIDWGLHGWANVNRFGDYHAPHNHPRAYLSGTYYVRIPEHQEALETRDDLRPGCISLFDPRGSANMTAIKRDPYVEAEYTVAPDDGMILLWPAFLTHFVHPNLSKEPRISISFNVMLDWKDSYLPSQD